MNRSLQILDAGTHTTVQDLGRPGHRAAGVASCGAVDPVSLRIANQLVGNPDESAGLECALVGPSLRFDDSRIIALCGAGSTTLTEGVALRVRARQTVHIGPLQGLAYAYLAVSGGVEANPVLGSRSTDVRVGIGGHEGRRLQRGDVLALGTPTSARLFQHRVNTRAFLSLDAPIRILPGSEAWRVDRDWLDTTFRISARSDRMGLHLEGKSIPVEASAADESSIVVPGTIQLPPGGRPIVLLADAQTLGGYPQIGHVIEVDLPRLAQRRPGAEVRFQRCTIDEAHRLIHQRERKLALLRYALCLQR